MNDTSKWYEFVGGVNARVNQIQDEAPDLTDDFAGLGIFEMVDAKDDADEHNGNFIYRTQGVVGLGYLEKKDQSGRIKRDEAYPSYKTEYVIEQKAKYVDFSKLLKLTRHSQMEKKFGEVKMLMASYQKSLKKSAWQVLVDSFSTTDTDSNYPIMRLGDDVSMSSTSHPSRVPGVANRSNRLAGDPTLSPTSAFDLVKMIREQKNGRGIPTGYDENFLFIVPPSLEQKAYEVFNSKLKADTGNNNINYFTGGTHDFVSINYLGTATSGVTAGDTSFYCIAKSVIDGQQGMKIVILQKPEIEVDADFFTKNISVSVDAAWITGYSNWEYMAGADGTND